MSWNDLFRDFGIDFVGVGFEGSKGDLGLSETDSCSVGGPAPSVAGSTHSRHTHRSGGGRGEGAGGGGSRHGSVNGGGEGSRHGSVGRGRDGSRHGSDRPMTYQSGGLSVSMGGDRIVLETRDGPGRILESVIEMGGRRRGRDRCYDSDSDSDIDSWD